MSGSCQLCCVEGWVSFVDGTPAKPGLHEEAYFDRKSNYSLNVQI